MTTTTIAQKNIAFLGTAAVALALFVATTGAMAAQAATITHQLDLGSTGADVTTLQTYLRTTPTWYPSGLVTGYFGNLTQGGVKAFQTAESIVSSGSPATTGFGRVGPSTMNRLNIRMNGVEYPTSINALENAPVLSGVYVNVSPTAATFTWSTNEPTTGQVYWSTMPIQSDEATGPNQTPYVSGTLALDAGGLQYNHSVTVSNLQTNVVYYYFVRSIDASGDYSIALPVTFVTR